MNRFLLIACVFVLMTGCAVKPAQPFMSQGDPAVELLNDSAQRIARAAEQSALAQSVRQGESRVTKEYGIELDRLPQELRDPLLLEGGFHGELELFLKSLTGAIGWADPVVFGGQSGVPLMVTLTEQRRPAVYWFADAGYQAQSGAEVIVNVELRQVVLTYKQPGDI